MGALSALVRQLTKAVTKKPRIEKQNFLGASRKHIIDQDNSFGLLDTGSEGVSGIKTDPARHRYSIKLPGGETVGTVSLIQGKEDTIKSLVNIEIDPKARKLGLGKKIVEAVSHLSEDSKGLEITDIQRNAINFWRKLGLTDEAKMFPKDKTSYSKKGFIPNPDINIDKAIGGRIMRDPNKNYNEQRFI
jgi:ribosomal protein S18 acetylase RimI-like enzyme